MDIAALNPLFRYVLVRTSHPGNIGSAARAIRTMGFTRLELIAPHRFPDDEATAMAAGADEVLAGAGIHADLVGGLAGATLVLGLSARRRGVTLPELKLGKEHDVAVVIARNARVEVEEEAPAAEVAAVPATKATKAAAPAAAPAPAKKK